MTELADFLTARGYVRVPLRRSGVGHFHTDGTLNGRPVEVMVDTGASCTVVAMAVVHTLGLRAERLDEAAGGAGGTLDQFLVAGADLRLGTLAPRLAGPAGIDFEQVNAPLRAQGVGRGGRDPRGGRVRRPRGRHRLPQPVPVPAGDPG